MLMGQSGHPGRDLTNEAVALAEAGLWKDAAEVIEAAPGRPRSNIEPPFTNDTVDWDYGLIKLHADAAARRWRTAATPCSATCSTATTPPRSI